MESCRPPVLRTMGREPYRAAVIWGRPQGSKREGMSMKSEAAKAWWERVSSKLQTAMRDCSWWLWVMSWKTDW